MNEAGSPARGGTEVEDAYERWLPAKADWSTAPVVLSCEHATERMPEPYGWPDHDRHLVGTHWASDLGARPLTLALAQHLRAPAVLSRFSRLLVDPNRGLSSDTLFRLEAEERPVALNQDLTDAEKKRRLDRFYRPYHRAFSELVVSTPSAPVVFSMHTFTPLYEGHPREMEVGVLFDQADELAGALGAEMEEAGLKVAYNAPYSGKAGMMYAVERHALEAGREAVELEVRQDLAIDPAFRAKLVPILASLFPRQS